MSTDDSGSRERTEAALQDTADDLADVAKRLRRSAEAAIEESRRHRLRALQDRVLAQSEAIRARVTSLRMRGGHSGDKR